MSRETHKQPGRDTRAERRERLAQELRANLLKRKALARARRSRSAEQAQAGMGKLDNAFADQGTAEPEPGDDLTRS